MPPRAPPLPPSSSPSPRAAAATAAAAAAPPSPPPRAAARGASALPSTIVRSRVHEAPPASLPGRAFAEGAPWRPPLPPDEEGPGRDCWRPPLPPDEEGPGRDCWRRAELPWGATAPLLPEDDADTSDTKGREERSSSRRPPPSRPSNGIAEGSDAKGSLDEKGLDDKGREKGGEDFLRHRRIRAIRPCLGRGRERGGERKRGRGRGGEEEGEKERERERERGGRERLGIPRESVHFAPHSFHFIIGIPRESYILFHCLREVEAFTHNETPHSFVASHQGEGWRGGDNTPNSISGALLPRGSGRFSRGF